MYGVKDFRDRKKTYRKNYIRHVNHPEMPKKKISIMPDGRVVDDKGKVLEFVSIVRAESEAELRKIHLIFLSGVMVGVKLEDYNFPIPYIFQDNDTSVWHLILKNADMHLYQVGIRRMLKFAMSYIKNQAVIASMFKRYITIIDVWTKHFLLKDMLKPAEVKELKGAEKIYKNPPATLIIKDIRIEPESAEEYRRKIARSIESTQTR